MLSVSVSQPRKPRGRPMKPAEDRRTERIETWLSPREADSVYRYAMRHGVSIHVVLRKLLLRLAGQ